MAWEGRFPRGLGRNTLPTAISSTATGSSLESPQNRWYASLSLLFLPPSLALAASWTPACRSCSSFLSLPPSPHLLHLPLPYPRLHLHTTIYDIDTGQFGHFEPWVDGFGTKFVCPPSLHFAALPSPSPSFIQANMQSTDQHCFYHVG